MLKRAAEGADLVALHVQLAHPEAGVEVGDRAKLVAVEPEALEVGEVLEAADALDSAAAQMQLCARCMRAPAGPDVLSAVTWASLIELLGWWRRETPSYRRNDIRQASLQQLSAAPCRGRGCRSIVAAASRILSPTKVTPLTYFASPSPTISSCGAESTGIALGVRACVPAKGRRRPRWARLGLYSGTLLSLVLPNRSTSSRPAGVVAGLAMALPLAV